MNILNRISKKELRDFLGKGWLTHDGMWFYHAYHALGIETANELNKAAIKSLAPIEVKRIKRLLGISAENMVSFNGLETFMHDALEITLPKSVFEKVKSASYRIANTKPTAFHEKRSFLPILSAPIVRG